jgi:hypothetical protein
MAMTSSSSPWRTNFDLGLPINRQRDGSADVMSTWKRSLCTASGDVKRVGPARDVPD